MLGVRAGAYRFLVLARAFVIIGISRAAMTYHVILKI
jgi:hypothetical protein